MNHKLLNYVVLVLFIMQQSLTNLYAQVNFEWAKGVGGTGMDFTNGIVVDANGNVYVTGSFNGTADFDPGPATANLTSAGNTGIFIAKYNAAGNYIWAKNLGGTGADGGSEIAVNAAGEVYVTGYFEGTADFDPGAGTANLVSNGNRDVFIAKYSPTGNYVWAKGIGSSSHESAYSIGLDATGNLYFAGYFQGTVDFDAGAGTANLVSGGGIDIFIAKYNTAGNYVWAKRVGGTSTDFLNRMGVDAAGNTYITGYFQGTVDFDPGAGTANVISNGGSSDVFLAKYDANGNYVWAKGMGGTSNDDYGYDITADLAGNVYVIGMFPGTVDFDPGPGTTNLTANGYVDVFLAKFDVTGNFVWAKSMGGTSTSTQRGFGVTTDAAGNIYTTGYFNSALADFDPGPGTAILNTYGSPDVFVAKYTAAGNYVWAKNMGGTSEDIGTSVTVGAGGNVYCAGSYDGVADFDPGPGTTSLSGYYNGFVLKLSQPSCVTFSTVTASACNSYTLNGQTYTISGSHAQTYTNAANCDSIVTLNLTLTSNSNSVSQVACNSFLFNSTTYTTSGVYTGTFTNAAGCDSVVTLNLTINQSSPVTQHTELACSSFVFNGTTYTQSGTYADTFTNAAGCDSVTVLNLTINDSDTLMVVSACGQFELNDSVYTQSGTYTQMLPTTAGCDSTITLQLTINSTPQASVVQTGATLIASSADAYQWVNCDNNYAAMPGATGQSYTATTNGRYAVIVTSAGGCKDTSDCFSVTGLSINELGSGNGVQVYPNPANGRLLIETEQALRNATIRLVNVAGQTLQEHAAQYGTLFFLDISTYADGIYFAEISEGENMVRVKIIKNDQ